KSASVSPPRDRAMMRVSGESRPSRSLWYSAGSSFRMDRSPVPPKTTRSAVWAAGEDESGDTNGSPMIYQSEDRTDTIQSYGYTQAEFFDLRLKSRDFSLHNRVWFT